MNARLSCALVWLLGGSACGEGIIDGDDDALDDAADDATDDTPSPVELLWEPRMDSMENIRADWNNPNIIAPPTTEFVQWPQYQRKVLRAGSDSLATPPLVSDGSTITGSTWRAYLTHSTRWQSAATGLQDGAPVREAWLRYAVVIEPDVEVGINELGVKLPGFESRTDGPSGQGFSTRMWHGIPSDGIVDLAAYWYGPDWTQGGWGGYFFMQDVALGEVIWIEQHLALNSFDGDTPNADGVMQVKVNGVMRYDRSDLRIAVDTTQDINHVFGNLYHGGTGTPANPIHYQLGAFALSLEGWIGFPEEIATLELDLNGGSWAGGWDQPGTNGHQRVNMEYSNAHQHTSGRQLEFGMGMHSRMPGDNTGVRWADFATTGSPTMGYYWPNNDTLIWESDNHATFYLPWRQWVIGLNLKIIDLEGPSAVMRWPSTEACAEARDAGQGLDMTTMIEVIKSHPDHPDSYWRSNYNPVSDVNPGDSTFTFTYGGGYFNSYPNGVPAVVRILDDNPDYPSSSNKPLRLRVLTLDGQTPAPTHVRHGARLDGWFYWIGAGVSVGGVNDFACHNELYRINLTDLEDGVFTQERLADGPTITQHPNLPNLGSNVRYPLTVADERHHRIIHLNSNGVYYYDVASDTWWGPLTFGMTTSQWAETLSEGKVLQPEGIGNWHGLIGTHRSDLGQGQTNFRYNDSRAWNRIRWSY